MTHSKILRVASSLAAALVLAACGQTSPPASAQSDALRLATNPYQTLSGDQQRGPGPGFPGGLAARLNLTAEQQASLKAIAEKYRPAGAGEQHQAELKALLLADTVDVSALKAFIAARHDEMTALRPQFTTMLGEFRTVLTDAQRQQLVTMIN